MPNIEFSLFSLFSIITLLSGFMVISSRNPIHSVLYLVLAFFNSALLLLLLKVEFIAMLFLIVYVGAIAVLFLFIVMMINIKTAEKKESLVKYFPIGLLILGILIFELKLAINSNFIVQSKDFINIYVGTDINNPKFIEYFQESVDYTKTFLHYPTIRSLGLLLYTVHPDLLIIASIILLVAMVGAIVLTISKKDIKLQNIYDQTYTDFRKAIINKKIA